MLRPTFVTEEDLNRWSTNIDEDKRIPQSLINSPLIREVCYAGCWLAEELEELKCPEHLIVRIQHAAGKLSFGRDIWEVHQFVLNEYKNNNLEFETGNLELN